MCIIISIRLLSPYGRPQHWHEIIISPVKACRITDGDANQVGNKTDRSIMAARKQTGNSSSLVPLFDKETEGVVYFVLFIGDTHSGHGIIGSMMDAHPNMVIAHEYM